MLKKTISIITTLALALSLANPFTVYAMKSSKEKVQEVSTVAELKNYLKTSKSIRLTKDLDLDYAPITIDEYKGTFNGANHTISHVSYTMFKINRGTIKNLVIDDSSYVDCIINKNYGKISSIRVVNSEAHIEAPPIKHERNFRGALVEHNKKPGVVENCVVDVAYSFGEDTDTYATQIGGIVGYNAYEATLQNCCFWGSLPDGYSSYIGHNASGTVINCYDTILDEEEKQTQSFLDELNLTAKKKNLTQWELANDPYPTPILNHEIKLKSVKNGYITASKSEAYKDTKVTLTVHPQKNYSVKSIKASGITLKKVRKNVYQFTMPDEEVTVTVKLKKN